MDKKRKLFILDLFSTFLLLICIITIYICFSEPYWNLSNGNFFTILDFPKSDVRFWHITPAVSFILFIMSFNYKWLNYISIIISFILWIVTVFSLLNIGVINSQPPDINNGLTVTPGIGHTMIFWSLMGTIFIYIFHIVVSRLIEKKCNARTN